MQGETQKTGTVSNNTLSGILFVVATPIGNLDDISQRAIEVLSTVDIICAEDTRHTHKLLNHIHVDTKTMSLHEHNERERINQVLTRLAQGQRVAIVSDAGTPAINDPGFVVVRAVKEAGYHVAPVPGACALIAALCCSGLATDSFIFDGFLPSKTSARTVVFERYLSESRTIVLYESSHRIVASLRDLVATLGDERRICVARELTKLFETVVTGQAHSVLASIEGDANQRKGEFVLLIEGVKSVQQTDTAISTILLPLMAELPLKQASKITAKITGCSAKYAYQIGLDAKQRHNQE